jgi:hypothetical protein
MSEGKFKRQPKPHIEGRCRQDSNPSDLPRPSRKKRCAIWRASFVPDWKATSPFLKKPDEISDHESVIWITAPRPEFRKSLPIEGQWSPCTIRGDIHAGIERFAHDRDRDGSDCSRIFDRTCHGHVHLWRAAVPAQAQCGSSRDDG